LPSGEDSPTTASGLREVDATRASDRRVEGRGNSRETAISNAMVRLTHELYGKGAKRAKSYLTDDMLFCALEEPLTVVERTLVEGGLSGMVRQIRIRFQDLTEDRFTGEVAQATGCTVLNCHTQIVFDPDVLFLIFVLEADAKATRGSDVLKPGVSG
ncbi:MAG: DUF2294 family protein, partial [Solirubrobacterales bacterium]|nr:DUF2294 family protein [Solirubrobacterales bacterium]